MSDRRRLLTIAAALALGGLGLDQFAVSPWLDARAQTRSAIETARTKLDAANAALRDEPNVAAAWKAVTAKLDRVRPEESANQFNIFLQTLVDGQKLEKATLKPAAGVRPLTGTAYRIQAVDMTFRCSWEAFVKLLLELNNADAFVRVESLTVTSQYQRGNHLDVTLRVSTLSPLSGGSR